MQTSSLPSPTFAARRRGATALLAFAAGIALGALPATAEQQRRDVAEFREVGVAGKADVDIQVGPTRSVVLEADAADLPHLKAEVKDGELHIGYEHNWFGAKGEHGPYKAHITTPHLESFGLAGAGTARITGMEGKKAELKIAGSGEITATGKVDTLEVEIAGSGNIKVAELAAREAEVKIAGSGDAEVKASQDLEVSIAGSGNVSHVGQPANGVKTRIMGSGRVSQR